MTEINKLTTLKQLESCARASKNYTDGVKAYVLEDTNASINDGLSIINKNHYSSKLFDNNDYPFINEGTLRPGCTYLLLFNGEAFYDEMYKQYENVESLCALSNSVNSRTQIISDNLISKDRHGINIDEATVGNSMWLCEPFNNNGSQFTLKNMGTNKYLQNNNGSVSFSDTITGNNCAWTIVNRTSQDKTINTQDSSPTRRFVYSTLTSVSDSSRFIRVSTSNNEFSLGSTGIMPDNARDANIYLYRYIKNSYIVNFQTYRNWNINNFGTRFLSAGNTSLAHIDYETNFHFGNIVLTPNTNDNQDQVYIRLPESENIKRYKKFVIVFEKPSGVNYGCAYYTQDNQSHGATWFSSSDTAHTGSINLNYPLLRELRIGSQNANNTIAYIKDVVFYDPEVEDIGNKPKEYILPFTSTDNKRATSIEISASFSNSSDKTPTIMVSNNVGGNVPRWEDATEAFLSHNAYNFYRNTDLSDYSGGIGIKVLCSSEDENQVFCNGISYKIDLGDEENYSDATTTEHGLMSVSDKIKLDGIESGAETNNIFIVTVTKSGNTYTSSHSLDEIIALENTGKTVVLKYNNQIYTRHSYTSGGSEFYVNTEGWSPYDYKTMVTKVIVFSLPSSSKTVSYYNYSGGYLPAISHVDKKYVLKDSSASSSVEGWQISEITDFKPSGSNASQGLVPQPPTTAGTSKYLCEDGSWKIPADTNTTYTLSEVSKVESQYGNGTEIKLTDNTGAFSSVALTALADSGIVIEQYPGQTGIFNVSLSPAVQAQLGGLAQLRADIDYVAMMTGVVLVEEEEEVAE